MRLSFLRYVLGTALVALLGDAGTAVAQQPVACSGLRAFWCGHLEPPPPGPLVIDAVAPACSECILGYRAFARDDMELLLPYFGFTREPDPDGRAAINLFEIAVSGPG